MKNIELTVLSGIGSKRLELFAKLGIETMRDLLFFLPREYKDFSEITPCAALEEGDACALVRIAAEPRVYSPRRGMSILTAKANDETGKVDLVWYNQPYMKKNIQIGEVYMVFGKVDRTQYGRRFLNPSIEPIDSAGEGAPSARGILPVYPLTAGLTQKIMRSTIRQALEHCNDQIKETLPASLRLSYSLSEINFALSNIHFPADEKALEQAKRRLALEELLFFLLTVAKLSRDKKNETGIAFQTDGLLGQYLTMLPFEPTEAQRKVLAEIERDMAKETPMNRLAQGDVGSGKTVLAMFALFIAAENSAQGALLAPTEILARQHYETALSLFGGRYGVELLVGGMTQKRRQEAYERLRTGEAVVVIGTHALIAQGVEFKKLGVIVTDEQHRFGVRQRAAIAQKGNNPDVLIMSATPIPRTLSLILYGDLDVSVLDALPPGRKRIQTNLVPTAKRNDLYGFVKKQAQGGYQAYIICPLVEESELVDAHSAEQLFEELRTGPLLGIAVELLHGRLDNEEKTAAVDRFRRGETKVLVSTTVVEVGVNVPNATVMVIEDADRFGLAQLHQLRGRVGRGSVQSYCFLLTSSDAQETLDRLSILCKSQDGFEIAQRDLELRGPGEFLGTRQSGVGDSKIARLIRDMDMLKEAQEMANRVMNDPAFENDRQSLLDEVDAVYAKKLQSIAMN